MMWHLLIHRTLLFDNIIPIGLYLGKTNPNSYLIVQKSDHVGKRRASDTKGLKASVLTSGLELGKPFRMQGADDDWLRAEVSRGE